MKKFEKKYSAFCGKARAGEYEYKIYRFNTLLGAVICAKRASKKEEFAGRAIVHEFVGTGPSAIPKTRLVFTNGKKDLEFMKSIGIA